jgi:hypothetical protein
VPITAYSFVELSGVSMTGVTWDTLMRIPPPSV